MKQCRNAHKTRKRQHFQQRQIPKRGGRVKGCLEYFRKFIHIEEQKRTTFLKDDRRIYGHEIMGKEVFLVNCSAPGGGCVPLQLPDSAELATQRSRIAATLPPAGKPELGRSSCSGKTTGARHRETAGNGTGSGGSRWEGGTEQEPTLPASVNPVGKSSSMDMRMQIVYISASWAAQPCRSE